MTIAISGTNGITLDGQFNSASSMGFKNRLINSAMVIDQRNAGASQTPNGTFVVDRWIYQNSQASKFTAQQNQNSVTPPAGFTYYSGLTSSSAYTLLAGDYFLYRQFIEGFNVADLAWGTASAATVTLSFWVRSSLTGTFGGALNNSGQSRSYPFTYTISSANTWEQKSITVAGDTSGTWLTTNGIGLIVGFSLGTGSTYSGTAGSWAGSALFSATGATSVVGTNGATWYVTGVQLEKGSTATSFDYRPYGTELALCQRYYESTAFPDASFGIGAVRITISSSTTSYAGGFNYLVPKRTNSPTVTLYSRNNNSGKVSLVSTGADVAGTSIAQNIGGTGFWGVNIGTPPAAGSGIEAGWTASSEL